MFDFVRKNTRILQFVLFLLIFPSFVLFGIQGYMRMNDRGEVVATVGGHDIRQNEWDAAHKREVDRLRETMPNLDPKLLDTPQARYATLERMIRERVISEAAQDDHLVTSNQRLAAELQRSPVIASLRGPDGRIDMARYRQLAAAQGMTPEGFENQLRADLSNRQVLNGLLGSSFATPLQTRMALDAFLQRREAQVLRFDPAAFAARVTPSEAEIEAFYKANPQLFQAPEQVDIEYLVLDPEALMKDATVNEADLKTYYEQNAARQSAQEERRASHILIAAPASAPPAEREAAKRRAEQILAEVRQSPQRFAEFARKYSQDKGSAARGGDLDWFTRGAILKPIEDAAFGMKKGEISGVVASDKGFHIIQLTDVRAPKQRSFEEMRPELEKQMREQQAQRMFADKAEAFSNAVYEAADGLKSVAQKFKLPLRTASGVTREPAKGATGPLASTKFLDALYSNDSLENKRNTEAVEFGPNQLVSGRVTRHIPAHTLPLAEVRARVVEQLKHARGLEMAKKAGAEQFAALKANPAAAQLPPAVLLSREDAKGMPQAVVEATLRADPKALPATLGVDLGDEGYAVVRVDKIVPRPAPAEAVAKQEREQVAQWEALAEGRAYYELLKNRYKVQIKVPAPAEGQAPAAAR